MVFEGSQNEMRGRITISIKPGDAEGWCAALCIYMTSIYIKRLGKFGRVNNYTGVRAGHLWVSLKMER
jgi:hypothetical protein